MQPGDGGMLWDRLKTAQAGTFSRSCHQRLCPPGLLFARCRCCTQLGASACRHLSSPRAAARRADSRCVPLACAISPLACAARPQPHPTTTPPHPTPRAPRLLAYSGFPFPIALTMWHMAFCSTVGFICIRVLGLVKSHNLSARDYMQRVMPIGVLYAASLWLSNSAYLYLSVSFIQMTKSLMPGLVYACGILLGTEQYEVGRCSRATRSPLQPACAQRAQHRLAVARLCAASGLPDLPRQ